MNDHNSCHFKKLGEKKENTTGEVSGDVIPCGQIPLMLLLKVTEHVYVLETACQSFLVVLLFFLKSGFPFSCLLIAVMSSDLKFHKLNRGASAS